jgi:Predicted nucleotidyltransferase
MMVGKVEKCLSRWLDVSRPSVKPYVAALSMVARVFRGRGVDFVLVGSLVLPLAYGIDWNVHDVDVFLLNKSTLTDEEFFEEVARENDWDVGLTAFGGVYYEVVVGGEVVRIDLMENLLDVYMPQELLNDTVTVRVDGEEVRAIRLEGLIVLKAREATDEAEEFLEELASVLADPRTGVELDKGRVRRYIESFPEDERGGITHRIEVSGIYLD